jgi:pimeloyl-ACP methyl ester carboxylesterase
VASCAVGDHSIAYERSGSGAPVVMLNGFAGTRADWDPDFLDALQERNELILLDNRGVGESTGGREPFSIEDLAGDTAAVIDGLGLERPCVLGWSMGGAVAMALALSRPELARSLVLLASHAGGWPVFASVEVRERLADLTPPPREQARRVISALFTPERAASIDASAGEIVAAARADLDPGVVTAQGRALDEWGRGGCLKRLDEIRLPVLVAAGAQDIVIEPRASEEIAGRIDGAWLARFPRSGHAFMADHPESLAGLIAAFLGSQR